MNPKVPALAVGGVVLLAALAGCSSKDKGENSIAITATDSACDVATTELSQRHHDLRRHQQGQ